MNARKVYLVVFEDKLAQYLRNQQSWVGPVAGWGPERPAPLQHLPAGLAPSPLAQPFPSEGFPNGQHWSHPLLPGGPGASALRLQQAELCLNAPLVSTYGSFSKRLILFHHGPHRCGE